MIKKLMFLNGIATIAAVFHHSVHWIMISLFMWQERILPAGRYGFIPGETITIWFFRITDQFAGVAVPLFLFVSGFFYGFANNRTTTKFDIRWIASRIRYIWIPFAVWSSIILVLRVIEGSAFSLVQLVDIYIWGKAAGPYYYIPLIIQYIILSPFLFYLLKRFPRQTFSMAILIQVAASLTWYTPFLNISSPGLEPAINFVKAWHVPHNLVWFTGGMCLYLYQSQIIAGLKKIKYFILATLVVLVILTQLELSQFIQYYQKDWIYSQSSLLTRILYFALILLIIVFQDSIQKNSWIERLGTKSFGVYLAHILFLEVFARALYHVFPQLMRFTPVFWSLLMVFALAGPLILMRVAEIKPIKRIYPYVFG
ncbi:MAG: acyltransferase [Chloroflexota bacterium]